MLIYSKPLNTDSSSWRAHLIERFDCFTQSLIYIFEALLSISISGSAALSFCIVKAKSRYKNSPSKIWNIGGVSSLLNYLLARTKSSKWTYRPYRDA